MNRSQTAARNHNERGSAARRRARRAWIWTTYAVRGVLRCFHCGRRVYKASFHVDRWPTCGHAGGRYVQTNIVAACARCNLSRCRTCTKGP